MSQVLRRRMPGEDPGMALNILVLDDDLFDRKRVIRRLKAASGARVNVTEAADLPAFGKALSSDVFDLIFLDFALGDGDAMDAMRLLFESEANMSAFLVMVSGAINETQKQEVLSAGCDAFLEKADLSVDAISAFLGQAQLLRQPGSNDGVSAPQDAVGFWATRAKRRRFVPAGNARAAPEARQGVKTQAQPAALSTWQATWPGQDAFLREFADVDMFEFRSSLENPDR